nr:class I SAM-dependent methyltransferase [Methanobrevibacter arboriphilus]
MGGGGNAKNHNLDYKLLDIGCNDGIFTKILSDKIGYTPYGVDFLEDLIVNARNNGVLAKKANIDSGIPFDNSFFDLIVSNQVIEHVMETDNFFKEIYRLLKPNGYAIISCPNITSFHNLGLMIFGMQPVSFHSSHIQVGNPLFGTKIGELSSGLRHVKIFTAPALKDLATHHGFEVLDIYGYGHYYIPKFISSFLSKLTPRYSIYIGIVLKKL